MLRTVLKSNHLHADEKKDWARRVLQEMDRNKVKPDHRIHHYIQLLEGNHELAYTDELQW
jgi:hypothetical protein